MRTRTVYKSLSFSLIIGLALAACRSSGPETAKGRRCVSYGDLSICDLALDYYEQHGGAAVFGYPTTDRLRQGDTFAQYLENAVIQYPADDPRPDRVHLRPLGTEIFEPTPPEIPREDPDCRYFEDYGHFVCLSFLDFYHRIGGESVVGQPTSKVMVEDGVRVQYFENAKFRWIVEPGPPRAALEAWGRQACLDDGLACQDYGYAGPKPDTSAANQILADMEAFAAAHGGDAVLGQKLGHLVYAGAVAYRYYENACLLWTPGATEPVSLAPLGRLDAPDVPRIDPPPSDTMMFFPATGHSVVQAFLDFYLQSGGEPIFGLPLTEFTQDGDTWVQWFENVLMEWHPELPDGERVQLAPLGKLYHQRLGGALPAEDAAPPAGSPAAPLPQDLVLMVVPQYPILPRGEVQMINVLAQDYAGRPRGGIASTLYFTTGAWQQILAVPSTDEDGSAWMELKHVEGECGEVMRLRAVARAGDEVALADGQFVLWCKPSP